MLHENSTTEFRNIMENYKNNRTRHVRSKSDLYDKAKEYLKNYNDFVEDYSEYDLNNNGYKKTCVRNGHKLNQKLQKNVNFSIIEDDENDLNYQLDKSIKRILQPINT